MFFFFNLILLNYFNLYSIFIKIEIIFIKKNNVILSTIMTTMNTITITNQENGKRSITEQAKNYIDWGL